MNLKNKRIYLDYASATPIGKKAAKALTSSGGDFFNPSSLYKEGVDTKKKLEEARKSVATLLRARPESIFFTSSGTESNNIAIQGVVKSVSATIKNPHIIISAIEHSSIKELIPYLKSLGAVVDEIFPDENGIIDPKKISEKIRKETILVSVMHVNNETGVIQPIKEISRVIKKSRQNFEHNFPIFHCDMCQSINTLPIDLISMGVDMATLDSLKFYGPKVGILYKKIDLKINPLVYGGGQEKGLRSGTENVSNIFACAEALSETISFQKKEAKRLSVIQNYFEKKIKKISEDFIINCSNSPRVPNISSISIKGLDAEFAVLQMDAMGFAISSGSACLSSKEDSYSYVIKALGRDDGSEKSTLRFSFGRGTTKKHIDDCIESLKKVLLIQGIRSV